MSRTAKAAILLSLLAFLVFIAAFMPWGTVNAAPSFSMPAGFPGGGGSGGSGGSGNLFGGIRMEVTVTGWNGSMSPGGLQLPNWLVVLAAGGVAALAWLKAGSIWMAPTAVPIALAAYGFLHAAFAALVFIGSKDATLGVGSCITAAAFVAMTVVLARGTQTTAA